MFSSSYSASVVSIHFNFVTQQNSTCKGGKVDCLEIVVNIMNVAEHARRKGRI